LSEKEKVYKNCTKAAEKNILVLSKNDSNNIIFDFLGKKISKKKK